MIIKNLYQYIVKRFFDILLSLIILITTSPLLLIISYLIFLDSPGEIIFKQTRLGKDQRKFTIYKFRSMYTRKNEDIDQYNEPLLTSSRDKRITRIGSFIRSTSIDELPQIFNILKGDMSFVGPRPVLIEQLDGIPKKFFKRFEVLPGLSGLAQVNGRRGLDWIKQLQLDSNYSNNFNFLMDLGIVLKTIPLVLMSNEIYGSSKKNWRFYRDIEK